MLKKYKQLLIGIVIGSVVSTAGAVLAVSNSVTALLEDHIKFIFNGVQKQVPDGYAVLNYEGRTYVPTRFIAEQMGADVDWDAKKETVIIKSKDKITSAPAQPAGSTGLSRSNPASKGQAVSIGVKNLIDDYNATVSLREVLRGEEAWKIIKEANMFNIEAKEGYEYILAKLLFKVNSNQDNEAQVNVGTHSFTLVSKRGKEYDTTIVVTPEPKIDANLKVGSSKEGWAVFQVKKDDTAPLITFGRGYDGRGGIWLKAYE